MTWKQPATLAFLSLVALLVLSAAPSAWAATVLLVTQNSSINSEENARKSQFQSWGYTVTTIVDSATQTSFNTAVASADVAYIPSTVDDWELTNKLKNAAIGVLCEERYIDDDMGFSTNTGWDASHNQVEILDNSHEVTSGLSTGYVTITTSNQQLALMNPTVASGMTVLGKQNYSAGSMLGVIEAGGALAGGGTAAARRVRLPWGGDAFSFGSLNSAGRTILQNALAWAGGGVDELVAHWKLNESTGISAADATGYGHTGTVTGTASWTSAIRNNGFSFNGSTKVQASGLMDNPKNITVAAWANLTAADTNGAEIISLGDHVVLRLDEAGSTNAYIYNGSTWIQVSVNQTFAGTGWHHFAAVFEDDNNSFKLYVDGVQVDSTSTTSSISYSGQGSNTVIGRHGNGATDRDFTGVIDDVRVYNYALSASEIVELYGFLGHWKLDQTSGTTATDSSPMANNGTYVNGVTLNQSGPYPGAGNKAASFDGSNDYVSVPNESKYDSVTDECTVAAWINVDIFDVAWQALVTKGDSAWRISRNDLTDALHFSCTGLTLDYVNGSVNVNDGKWHHVVGVYTGSQLRLYVDGQLDNSVNCTGTISTNNQSVQIGRNAEQSGREFDGKIHDVRVYNRALNAWEITQLYGLVGRWKLTETSGISAADSSLAANNGTYTGGVTLNASGPYAGQGSKAASFDGNNDYVATANEYRYDMTGAVAVAAWIKVSAFDKSWQTIVAKGDSSWRLARDGTTDYVAFGCNLPSSTKVVSTTNVNDGRWHHVVGMYDGSALEIYVDGLLDNSTSATGTISTNNHFVQIGENAENSGRQWNGLVHDVRVYNRALADREIEELYGLVGHWMLSDTSGTTATDSTLSANNGTYVSGVSLNQSGPVSGTIAAQFDGFNDHVTAPTQADFSKGFSLAVWARPTAAGSWARFMDLGAGQANSNLYLCRYSTGTTLEMAMYAGPSGNTYSYVRSTNAIELNTWHHYAGTVDYTGQAKLYRDGVELTITSGSAGYPNIGVPNDAVRTSNYIAKSNWPDAYYQGKMWDARLYNRPLSAEEVQTLFQAGSFAGVKIIKWVEIQ